MTVVISKTALVDVGANKARADISGFAFAQVTTVSVGADGLITAVVVAGAFVVVDTVATITSETRLAAATVGPVASHGAVSICVTGVVTLVEAKVPISTGKLGLHCVDGRVVVVTRKFVIRRIAVVFGSDCTVSVDADGFVYRQFRHISFKFHKLILLTIIPTKLFKNSFDIEGLFGHGRNKSVS